MAEKTEIEKWIKQYKSGDMNVFQCLLENYCATIKKAAAPYCGVHGLDSETLYWEGAVGLHKALQTYDIESGRPFGPYASASIKNAIRDAVREENNSTEAQLTNMGYRIVSIDAKVSEDDDTLWEELITNSETVNVPDDGIITAEERREQAEYDELEYLSKQSRAFLDYRYGLFDMQAHSLPQTARHFGIGQNEAVRMLYDALCECFGEPEILAREIGRKYGDDPEALRTGFLKGNNSLPISIRKKLLALELARPAREAAEHEDYERIWNSYNLGLWHDRECGYPPQDSA